jgi:hypothetical protein
MRMVMVVMVVVIMSAYGVAAVAARANVLEAIITTIGERVFVEFEVEIFFLFARLIFCLVRAERHVALGPAKEFRRRRTRSLADRATH